MTTGVPMNREICREIIEMVEGAVGPEIIRIVRETHAAFHPIWEAMTDEERCNWVMGIVP